MTELQAAELIEAVRFIWFGVCVLVGLTVGQMFLPPRGGARK
jgi:hypothetical protein